MNQEQLFQVVLIVRETRGVGFLVNSDITFEATLEKGRKFEAVTWLSDEGDKSYFHDAETGMHWVVAADAIFPLSGRFSNSSDVDSTD